MKGTLIVSLGYGLFFSLVTGSRVTSSSGVDPVFSSFVMSCMLVSGIICLVVGMVSRLDVERVRRLASIFFVVCCGGSFTLCLCGSTGLAASVFMGIGLACGYVVWGDMLVRCSRNVVVIVFFSTAIWGVIGSSVTLVDDYALRMAPMLVVLAGSMMAYFLAMRGSYGVSCVLGNAAAERAFEEPPSTGRKTLLSVSRSLASVVLKPTLLVGILGFSSGILRVLTATSGTDPAMLSVVRFSCALAVALLFLFWSRRATAFETSPITLVLLFVATSAFMLLPFVGPQYQVALASVVDTVYLLAGSFLSVACALAARNEDRASMLSFGYGQGVSTLFTSAGFSVSTFLANGSFDNSLSTWALALGSVYLIMIIVVVFSMPQVKSMKSGQRHSIRMVLTVSESAVRENRVLNERYRISAREMDVLVLALTGRNAAAIAEALFLSESTVRTHLKHIYRKLDIHSKEDLHYLVERLLVEDGGE